MSYCHIEDAKTVLEIGIVGVEMIKASLKKVTVAKEIPWIMWVASVVKIWIWL